MKREPLQLQFMFPSLDRPDRFALRVNEMAELLGCSEEHIRHLIEDGTIQGGDISRNGKREHLRVSREAWADYVIKTFGSFERKNHLRPLSDEALRELIADCQTLLKTRSQSKF